MPTLPDYQGVSRKGTDLPLALPYGPPNLPDLEPSDGLLLGYNRLFSFSLFLFKIEHIFIVKTRSCYFHSRHSTFLGAYLHVFSH